MPSSLTDEEAYSLIESMISEHLEDPSDIERLELFIFEHKKKLFSTQPKGILEADAEQEALDRVRKLRERVVKESPEVEMGDGSVSGAHTDPPF